MHHKFEIVKVAPKGGLMASKWLSLPLFITGEDLKDALDVLQDGILAPLGYLVDKECLEISKEIVLKSYAELLQSLLSGEALDRKKLRDLTLRIAFSEEDLYAYQAGENRFMVYERKPAIHMQPLFLSYSSEEKKFRSKVLGGDQIFWGVEFSFPQIYQDPFSQKMEESWNKTEGSKKFKLLQKWSRRATKPAKFIIGAEEITVPFRKSISLDFKDIHHPQLKDKGITLI